MATKENHFVLSDVILRYTLNSLSPGGDLSQHHFNVSLGRAATSGLLVLRSIYSTVMTSYDIEKTRGYTV